MALEIIHLSACYGKHRVLHGVDLTLPRGEVMALVGPNGAGKTTLLRVLSGTLQPCSGTVQWEGMDLLALSPRERAQLVAVVPQARDLPVAFTVEQAVTLGRTPYLSWLGAPGPRDRQAVEQALAETDLLPLAARRLAQLSGGEQQRVLLARALAQETPILLLDEPTTHLDLRHQANILRLIQQFSRERGLTVLMVIHDLNLAAHFADRVALLDHGVVLAVDKPEAVLTTDRIAEVYHTSVNVLHIPQGHPVVVLAE